MENQKKLSLSRIVAGLMVISLLIVGGLAIHDAMIDPSERYKIGILAMSEGDYRKAERAFLIVNEDGNAKQKLSAAYYLGRIYYKGGKNFPANGQKSALFFEKAALGGMAGAQYQLALMYDVGDKIPENRSKALMWMNEAAKQGKPEALYSLGVWIERGYMGDDIQMDKVVALYEAAAAQGHKNAMTSLVNIYAEGYGKFPYNIEKSNYWRARLDELNARARKIKKIK